MQRVFRSANLKYPGLSLNQVILLHSSHMTLSIMNVDFITPNEHDLCDLVQAMRLDAGTRPSQEINELPAIDSMHHDATYENAAPLSPTSSSGQLDSPPSQNQFLPSSSNVDNVGCAYLQSLQSQLSNYYTTTGGEYLESILTHRELVMAYPEAHKTCAIGWTNIAQVLDRREWRADREGDREAANAFRYEAWWLASWL